jgi:hypothetical protein
VAYVGNQPARGQWRKLSDISSAFDGVITTFTTSVPPGTSQYFVTAGSASQLLISLGGVIQEPDVDYTVSTNSVTFTTPPTSGLSFFGVLCGDALNAGVPSDGSVTTSKLAGGLSVGLTGGSVSTPSLFFTGDDNTGVFSAGADQLNIATNGVERVEFGTSEVVFNDGGANYDFRIEGDTNANLFFVDASAEAVGIGTSSVSTILNIRSNSSDDGILLEKNDGTGVARLFFDGTSSDARLDMFSGGAAKIQLKANGDSHFSGGRLGIGTASPGSVCHVAGSNGDGLTVSGGGATGVFRSSAAGTELGSTSGDNTVFLSGSGTERMRIQANGSLLYGTTTNSIIATNNTTGVGIGVNEGGSIAAGSIVSSVNADTCLYLNRKSDDGILVRFYQDATLEGNISVSGTTVSYNGAHLSRWSQLPSDQERIEILRGSVLSNLDEMCEWIDPPTEAVLWEEGDELPEGVNVGDIKEPANPGGPQSNEQLNRMKVSDVEGDKNVSGVFQAWDDDDDTYTNDFYCAMTGDFIIRIAEGVTVERGDLLMSAGDGTAKPQDDDIIRSKTIAKVTSTNVSCTYEDGSYCVPCVLMAC